MNYYCEKPFIYLKYYYILFQRGFQVLNSLRKGMYQNIQKYKFAKQFQEWFFFDKKWENS